MPDFNTTDVAATVGQGQPNALQQFGGLLDLRQKQNALQLFPLEQQRLQLANTGAGITNATNQQALQAAKTQTLLAMLAATNSDDEVVPMWHRAVQANLVDADTAANAVGGNIDSFTPAAIHKLRAQAQSAAGNAAELAASRGTLVQTHTGGATVGNVVKVGPEGITSSAAEGPVASIADVQSPTDQGVMIGYQGADGQTKQIPKSAVQDIHGHGIPNVKDGEGNQLTDATGALTTTLKPSDLALINSTATNQADRASALETATEGSAQRKALIQELLQTNGEFRSGPGAAKWSSIVTEFNRVFGTKFEADPAAAQQVFGKIAQMIASQQRDTLGLPATNAGQQAADIASPNTEYSPKAIEAVAGQLAGNEDLLQKKEAAWNAYHKKGGSYNGFVRQFNKNFDPRYFWDQYVPDEQQATKSMSPPDAAAYEAARKRALGVTF